ncbi:MAG TPA: hypothetical protein VKA50_08105 [Gammaproteobacteria bacterium]|nr:hypothetical protein [Gammaproteobacteria bacterium]
MEPIYDAPPTEAPRERMMHRFKSIMAMMFSVFFLVLSLSLTALAIYQFASALAGDSLVTGIVQAINTAVIALATFELGIGVGKEYTTPEDEHNMFNTVRRTVTRFVGVVTIALVLEGLIMVIKYSQLELAGNLYYPVAIISSASLLLVALGGFLGLSRRDSGPNSHDEGPDEHRRTEPRAD